MKAIIPAVLSFVAAVALVRLLALSRFSQSALDMPNERSLHVAPVPRTGGLGLLSAASIGCVLLAPSGLWGLVALAGLLSVVTFADDRVGLPVMTRLFVQIAAAVLFLALYYAGPLWLLPLAFGALIWMANLYNFMDGSDGLAGGMTVAGFGAYAIAAIYAPAEAPQAEALAVIAASIAGGAGGFLVWNFHKASVFMGDSGSVPLGFLAAALGIVGWQSGIWPVWFPALVFSPFIADATVTLIKRFRRGEKLTQAHKTHYYQRALRMGLGHRGTALASYVLMGAVGVSALLARDWGPVAVGLMLGFWGAAYAALMTLIDRHWDAFSRDPARAV
ncbi:glycosyltransferase family 4 protein [Hyphomicrobium sp. LHD-15]|uniref:MraY family glycosyltransferase n=1 Tax=Hyphomicrobium sp. LHD-15 TaxID=3072142 RepID=UPI00280F2AE8|nr:glycosyltransferase family 4 protein [Hyphomicrobium sp. LHD-15]MDQ8699862.1 glycosyltransferase family 4 protein [Hyphomicrobium sp. LHD-15]